MKKTIIDEHTDWEYELKGDHYYPTGRVQKSGVMTPSELPEDNGPEEEMQIGIWGQRHLRYIRQHQKSLCFDLFVSGKLNAYLVDVNAQAEEMFLRLVKEMEGVAEELKAGNQILWGQFSNNIYARANETVNRELIFT